MKNLSTLLIAFVLFFAASCLIRGEDEKSLDRLAVVPFDTPDPTAVAAPDGSGIHVFVTGKGIPILFSRDMFQWKRIGRVFQDPVPAWAAERIKGSKGIWAPDVVYFSGLYHVYYSVSTFGKQRSLIGLAVNKTLDPDAPDYGWEDRGIVLESAPDKTDYNAIDSALFVDDDGKAYLFWGSYWSGLKAVEIDPKTGKPFAYRDGDLNIPENYVAVARRESSSDTSIEAPYVIRRGEWYYLFTSWGSCCDGLKSTYRIMIGRSRAPLGPYVDKDGKRLDRGGGSLVLESTERWKGTGHNGFFRTGKGEAEKDRLILAAHDVRNPEKHRMTQIRPVTWDASDWPVVGDVLERKAE